MPKFAQTITADRSTSPQVIDGSLVFDKTKTQFLKRTPGGGGSRTKWTMSFWMKRLHPGHASRFISTGYWTGGGGWTYGFYIGYNSDSFSFIANHGPGLDLRPSAKQRDVNGWYHCVFWY